MNVSRAFWYVAPNNIPERLGRGMITVPELAAEALSSILTEQLSSHWGSSYFDLVQLISSVARLSLECIGNSDALYHNVEHTMLVTLVGYEIMRGRMMLEPSSPEDEAHVLIACLLHDIGYIRGILSGDDKDGYVIDAKGNKAKLPRGSSDAALAPYHVDRSKLFAQHRLVKFTSIDANRIAAAIECTRFPPLPVSPSDRDTDEGSLVRAADLIGQLGDPHYLRKANALFCEFQEVGIHRQLGCESPADLVEVYPRFYYDSLAQHLERAIRYLNVTSTGRRWIAGLYSNVFRAERGVCCGS
jgi:hypothetical protein